MRPYRQGLYINPAIQGPPSLKSMNVPFRFRRNRKLGREGEKEGFHALFLSGLTLLLIERVNAPLPFQGWNWKLEDEGGKRRNFV